MNVCTECRGDRINFPSCTCPDQYFDTVNVNMCTACSFWCNTCQGSASNCLNCAPGRLNAPLCSCPVGMYNDPVSKNCLNCDMTC